MNINEFLQKYRRVKDGINVTRPRVRCADGYTVSVQAGQGLYSVPRADADKYTHVELGFPDCIDDIILPFVEDATNPKESVFRFVPVEAVDQLLSSHGGISAADYSNDHAKRWEPC